MKTAHLVIRLVLISAVAAGCTASAQNQDDPEVDLSTASIVVLKFEALPGQEARLREELTALVDTVRHEPHFINIKMHVNPSDAGKIMMYETWADGDYYLGPHMETSYILAFMERSRAFLAGPPEITIWQQVHDVSPPR